MKTAHLEIVGRKSVHGQVEHLQQRLSHLLHHAWFHSRQRPPNQSAIVDSAELIESGEPTGLTTSPTPPPESDRLLGLELAGLRKSLVITHSQRQKYMLFHQ